MSNDNISLFVEMPQQLIINKTQLKKMILIMNALDKATYLIDTLALRVGN